jgi:UTP-glucose-1-phosphate uridylyltransferase
MTHKAPTHALIPCGGKGTRMLSLTGGAPKELVEVSGIPVVERVARECAASGITDLLVVIAPGKEAIQERLAWQAGTHGMPERISFAVQREAKGLADAIRFGADFCGRGAIAVALPDNLFLSETPALQQVIDVATSEGKSAVAIVGITIDEARAKGATAIYGGEIRGHEYRISHIPDKGAKSATFDTGGAKVAYTGVGRYAFTPALWKAIDEVEGTLEPGAELDDSPVMQLLLNRGLMTGCLIDGRFLDVGLPNGYLEAVSFYTAMER